MPKQHTAEKASAVEKMGVDKVEQKFMEMTDLLEKLDQGSRYCCYLVAPISSSALIPQRYW